MTGQDVEERLRERSETREIKLEAMSGRVGRAMLAVVEPQDLRQRKPSAAPGRLSG